MATQEKPIPLSNWRRKLYIVVCEADTRAGRIFDLALTITILVSVACVMLESVVSIQQRYGTLLTALDWLFTILFTIEYGVRLLCARHPLRYVKSFFGVIDLLSILPLYLGLFIPESRVLADIRILRLLRVFRILNLSRHLGEAAQLQKALLASRRKITVFLVTVLLLVVVLGTLMFVIEGPEHGFTSIPTSIYWAIVTLTTVGFGDITPQTPLGRALASFVMITGYGIIAVPTGIVSAEIARSTPPGPAGNRSAPRQCPHCFTGDHDRDARFCKHCGGEMPGSANDAAG
ncbi:ion transporter [Burkholderia ubonensis]|uniref:Ion transporter n=1 Tax=Burkholderia ubonensis subsp. mesacidophila TaxID=265293 RepID=A0A2A4FIG6_9BURK|nr:ion transporter [Burkholderia ubonensis]PCE32905.1 ion transporter [Burkholderia ubonensis subsp. mesacidophila]